MEKMLYFECGTGISGDMTVAALLDLGADRVALERMLASLPLQGFRTEIRRVSKAGLDACDFSVILDHDNHDHDMEYLYDHEHGHSHEEDHHGGEHHHHDGDHSHEEEHHHGHHSHEDGHHHEEDHDGGHHHDGEHHHHHHEHRGLAEVLSVLRAADMTPGALALSEKIFRILAAAEAKAHGVSEEEVHFHEVGAVDSIVDVAAAAVCLDSLSVRQCVLPALCEGSGSVRCAHGILPVPVPAVLHIAEAHALPLQITPVHGELVTPTGAAIAAAVMTTDRLPQRFRVLRSGLGAGKRAYARPSLLRVMLIEPMEDGETADSGYHEESVVKLEANLDDCDGETLGYTLENLFQAGARDAWFTPIYMKKNRPAYLLSALCTEECRPALEAVLFRETTTIGVRRAVLQRAVLPRTKARATTSLGDVDIKRWQSPAGPAFSVEFESAAAIARDTGLPFRVVMERLRREIEESPAE